MPVRVSTTASAATSGIGTDPGLIVAPAAHGAQLLRSQYCVITGVPWCLGCAALVPLRIVPRHQPGKKGTAVHPELPLWDIAVDDAQSADLVVLHGSDRFFDGVIGAQESPRREDA